MTTPFRYSRRVSRAFEAVVEPPKPPKRFWRLLAPPDPLQVDAGAAGELLVAKIRLWITNILLLIPLFRLGGTEGIESWVGAGIVITAQLGALTVFFLVKRGFYRPWLGFATSLLDVSLVSAGLAGFFLLGRPHLAVDNKVLFEAYFLGLAATSLRYDPRICLATGLLAVLQYSAIVGYAAVHWDLHDARFLSSPVSQFNWAAQWSRVIIMAAAAFLSTTVVLRSQALRLQSRSDRLTGLPNRGYFDERVTVEISRARRYGHPLSLVMMDVDHFKRFNDTLGHAAGDVALKAVANVLRKMTRDSDLIVRYGGEEFVAVFPHMGAEATVQRAEAIRRAVSTVPFEVPHQPRVVTVTISAGVATLGPDGEEVEDLLDKADARLYQAKEAGRNRVSGPATETGNGGR